MKRMHFYLIIFFVLLGWMSSTSARAVPNLISYQGVLNDSNGTPLDSTILMSFGIYDSPTGGNLLWSESQNVVVTQGLFNVQLGSVQQLPTSVFESDTVYLGIQVESDPEMTPRQQITSGAYSYKAETIGHTGIPVGTIMAWSKNIDGIPSLSGNWVECNGQVIDDSESPINGQAIPNLNGENRFLRGNTVSGSSGGEEYHTLSISELPSHTHPYVRPRVESNEFGLGGKTGATGSYTTETGTSGDGQPHENRPPFYDIVWIIKIK